MILMLNCSYKVKIGNTQYFLELLKNKFAEREAKIVNIREVLNGDFAEFSKMLTQTDAFVIGAGLIVSALKSVPLEKVLTKNIENGMRMLVDKILKGEVMENYYAKTKVPRVIYMQAAHMLFRRALKKNGK